MLQYIENHTWENIWEQHVLDVLRETPHGGQEIQQQIITHRLRSRTVFGGVGTDSAVVD